jgi:hypothetical protein
MSTATTKVVVVVVVVMCVLMRVKFQNFDTQHLMMSHV